MFLQRVQPIFNEVKGKMRNKMKNIVKVWSSSVAFLLSAFSFLILVSCSQEEILTQETSALRFVVGDFPAFGGNAQTRSIGTQDEGKTAWANEDKILVHLYSQKYGDQAVTLTYDAENNTWESDGGTLSYLENETPAITAVYAPDCEIKSDETIGLLEGKKYGEAEYIPAKTSIRGHILDISFESGRTYSRLRIAAMPEATLTVTTTGFTPAGANNSSSESGEVPQAEGSVTYTLTADDKGNAYLYGVFAEGATVSVKQGDVTLKDYTFTAEKTPNGTEHNKSYALDATPVINLSQYSEGETVEIGSGGRIIGNDNEYNLTLNVAADATVIFEVGTSGVKLNGQITVADGKTLTLLVEGDAEHIVNGGISLGNGSNVIIEGDLTKENNKLTVTATDGNAGIGANNGVTAGDITIRNSRVDATGSSREAPEFSTPASISGAAIGTSDGSMGDILIENSIIVAEGGYYESSSHAAAIGIGYVGSTMGNITLKDSQITATNNGDGLASVIGAGWNHHVFDVVGTLGDIVITNTDLNLSMVIGIENLYGAFIGPGFINSNAYINMGKIIFTDMTRAELDEMIATWKDPNDFYEWAVYALGKEYKDSAFGGVWVSDGNGGTIRIDDGNGYNME